MSVNHPNYFDGCELSLSFFDWAGITVGIIIISVEELLFDEVMYSDWSKPRHMTSNIQLDLLPYPKIFFLKLASTLLTTAFSVK